MRERGYLTGTRFGRVSNFAILCVQKREGGWRQEKLHIRSHQIWVFPTGTFLFFSFLFFLSFFLSFGGGRAPPPRVFVAAYAVGLFLGRVSDRYSPRLVLTVAGLGAAASVLMYGLAKPFGALDFCVACVCSSCACAGG